MSLESEIEKGRKEIVSDGYDMSIGEIINLYRDEEIFINPVFQRLFRWDISRKTRFIESILLGIPIPPIFVFQDENGIWELIDGLQRLSTIFEFVGILRREDQEGDEDNIAPPSIMEGTNYLPSLAGKSWEHSSSTADNGIGKSQQLRIKRARMRVEILQQESDSQAKYELFQRLNTGGARLSEQEVRNCIAVMVNRAFYDWLNTCAQNTDFLTTLNQTEYALKRQAATELALRFFAFRNVPYKTGLDVHEYLDHALLTLANNSNFNFSLEQEVFQKTFMLLNRSMGNQAFRRWDGTRFTGKFLMSVYEVIATGLSKNLSTLDSLSQSEQDKFIKEKAQKLWSNQTFNGNSGAGTRGTTRLANLLPMADVFFKP